MQISNAREELLTNKKLTSMDLRLVTHNDLEHLVNDGEANHVRFEFYLYRKIAGMIESGKVYVSESERNKRLEDDLIPADVWEKEKSSLIEKTGVARLSNSIEHALADLESLSLRKRNTEARSHDLIACIFGNGANYGLHRLASSSDRSIGILRAVNDSYIRPETTGAANDLISNALARLPIFRHYTINESAPFGSIDGQKHACRINTFKTRYSAKYFRKGKGVSAMTLVSNHVPLNTTVISANEYEGHYAFDLLYNNSSDIQPKSLATDNHGTNNVNFAVLDIFGYQFSPKVKDTSI
ncbi:Tn3 family transposase [Vibrio sonorensis]|uniref:Tn3 family transposase n=1 Tax=Vibrio sonorensis TaxID=1004316 RepID=UPI0008D9E2F5|nr:Tn3 family transposase [Vibrio sonorensis]